MSGCLDSVDCDCEFREKAAEWCKKSRNFIASIIAGTLFGIGWWLIIDFAALYSEPLYAAYFICGVMSTVGLFMVNAISTQQVTGTDDFYTEGCLGKRGARVWMFFGFLFTFGGLVGSLWILIQKFLVVAAENSGGNHCITTSNNTTSNTTNSTGYVDYTFSNNNNGTNTSCPDDDPHVAQGVAFFLQNFFILLSTLIFKFGRTEEDPDSF